MSILVGIPGTVTESVSLHELSPHIYPLFPEVQPPAVERGSVFHAPALDKENKELR